MVNHSNEKRRLLNQRFTFRCTEDIWKAVINGSKKGKISNRKYITNCIEEYLNSSEVDKAALAECLCNLQSLLNANISDEKSKKEAQKRMDQLWHALI